MVVSIEETNRTGCVSSVLFTTTSRAQEADCNPFISDQSGTSFRRKLNLRVAVGQEAHDKAAELGVAKPSAEKLDLQQELQVWALLP